MSLSCAISTGSRQQNAENSVDENSDDEFELKGLAFAVPLDDEMSGYSDENGDKKELSSGLAFAATPSPTALHYNELPPLPPPPPTSTWTFFDNVWRSPSIPQSVDVPDSPVIEEGLSDDPSNISFDIGSLDDSKVGTGGVSSSVAPTAPGSEGNQESSAVRAVFISMLGEAHLHEHIIIHSRADEDVEQQIRATNTIPVKAAPYDSSPSKNTEDESQCDDMDDATHNTNTEFSAEKKMALLAKRLLCCGCILLLVGIAIVVGTLVGVNQSRNSSTSSIIELTSENVEVSPPAASVNLRPTIAPAPEDNSVIDQGISDDSWNDSCSRSLQLSDQRTVFGSTASLPPQQASHFPTCGGVSENGVAGLWYKMIGDNQVWTASTCQSQGGRIVRAHEETMDTQISVYQGWCEQLSCVAGNDQYLAPYHPCGDHAQISWFAKAGIEYFVRVHGYRDARGDFQLSVRSATGGTENENDRCRDALDLGPLVTELGSGKMFQTFDSTRSLAGSTSTSFACSASNTDGRWYTFQSDDSVEITISTCSDRTNYEALISVLQVVDDNDSCGSLQCAELTERTTCLGGGNVVRLGGNPATYYILVHGNSDANGPGEFELTIQPDFNYGGDRNESTCPEYGRLTNAGSISIPLSLGGATTTSVAATSATHPTCTGSTSAGYQTEVVGTGSVITLSTCHEDTNYDAPISVFVGDTCDELDCVPGVVIEEECSGGGFGSTVSFKSIFQTRYIVVVHDGDSDGFRSSLLKLGITEVNDSFGDCDSSQLVEVGGDSPVFGILSEPHGYFEAQSMYSLTGTCGDSTYDTSRPHAWYHVSGTGQVFTAHTCDLVSNFDTQISVFAGGCGELTCVVGNDQSCGDQSSISWQTQPGVVYHVLVHGHASRTGVFGLHVIAE